MILKDDISLICVGKENPAKYHFFAISTSQSDYITLCSSSILLWIYEETRVAWIFSHGFSPITTTQVLQQMLPAQGSLHIMAPVGHVLDEVISLSSVVASLTAQVEAGKHHS